MVTRIVYTWLLWTDISVPCLLNYSRATKSRRTTCNDQDSRETRVNHADASRRHAVAMRGKHAAIVHLKTHACIPQQHSPVLETASLAFLIWSTWWHLQDAAAQRIYWNIISRDFITSLPQSPRGFSWKQRVSLRVDSVMVRTSERCSSKGS